MTDKRFAGFVYTNWSADYRCPNCGATEEEGHKPDCTFDAYRAENERLREALTWALDELQGIHNRADEVHTGTDPAIDYAVEEVAGDEPEEEIARYRLLLEDKP